MFCLNDSESMRGQPWQDVCNAFQHFLQKRVRDQATSDLVSVIQFDHKARIAIQGESLREDLRLLQCSGRGTRFIPALNTAQSIVLNSQTAHIPVLIFVSDGAGGDSHGLVLSRMRELVQHCPSLNVHTIGFGPGAAHSRLQVRFISLSYQTVDNELLSGYGRCSWGTVPPGDRWNRSVKRLSERSK